MFAHRTRTAFTLFALLACVAGCSGGGGGGTGFLGLEAGPKGDIAVATYPGGTPLHTSAANPDVVDDSFSVSISETNFGGPYTITMYSWTNGFNKPCFVPHTESAQIYTFAPDNANAPSVPKTSPNPCKAGDAETALINDGKGHTAYFSFELSKALTGGAITPTPAPSGGGAACTQADPNLATFTITGGEQQFDFPACNDFTTVATLPANSGANVQLDVGTSSASQFSDATTPANGKPLISFLLEPSPRGFSLSNAAASISVSMTSPSKLGGGTFTLELRENGTVVETIPNLQPSNDQLFFNIHPQNGVFDLSQYVAIIYKN